MDSLVLLDVRFRGMRTGIDFTVSLSDLKRLEAIISAPSSPQKHVWRARIILLSADGIGTSAIMSATGKSKTCVWRWQARFMSEGVDGLLHEKTRPPGIPKTAADKTAEVIRLTQGPPPPDATHWTLRAMAKVAGLAASTVRDIWHPPLRLPRQRTARRPPRSLQGTAGRPGLAGRGPRRTRE